MQTLILIMSFANFLFYPLVIATIVAIIIEQIFRARGDEDKPEDVRRVMPLFSIHLFSLCSKTVRPSITVLITSPWTRRISKGVFLAFK